MKQVPDESSFQYTLLDEETRTIISQRASEIKNLMRLTAENIINIGAKLTEVKEQLEHGNFQSWLRTEFEWSEQTARQFMQVYRWSETIENKNFVFSQLATSALYLLAAPSTPAEAREEVLSIVNEGERVTYTRARNIVDRCKKSENGIENAIEVAALSEVDQMSIEEELVPNQLFRLKIPNFGFLVRLYRADELEAATEMIVGSTVSIKVGRWRGQTAKIVEIMTDTQSSLTEETEVRETASFSETEKSQITVRTLDEKNLSEEEIVREANRNLVICYSNVYLAVEAESNILRTFIEQLQTNPTYAEEIFERGADSQEI